MNDVDMMIVSLFDARLGWVVRVVALLLMFPVVFFITKWVLKKLEIGDDRIGSIGSGRNRTDIACAVTVKVCFGIVILWIFFRILSRFSNTAGGIP